MTVDIQRVCHTDGTTKNKDATKNVLAKNLQMDVFSIAKPNKDLYRLYISHRVSTVWRFLSRNINVRLILLSLMVGKAAGYVPETATLTSSANRVRSY